LLEDNTFTNPFIAVVPWESVEAIDNTRRTFQSSQTEGYFCELSLKITFVFRTIFSPPAPNWLEEIDVAVSSGKTELFPAAFEVGAIVVSVLGPASGTHGAPSAPFTVSLESGASFTGNQSVTIVDGGAGGVFAPSIGSPGTGSIVVEPPNGATSFTFTYAAAAPGAIVLTFTDAQGWRDPAGLSFTAS
jgi:hypothetical protein